jgi:RNA polymerase sigma-70 factor (ECF subfamily)
MNHSLTESINETELLNRARAGDFRAFQQLIVDLQPRVYALALRILRQSQDAEDATQQTFLALIEYLPEFRAESAFSTWVLTIATHAALKILKKRTGKKFVLWSELAHQDQYTDIPLPEFIAPWTQTADELLQSKEVQNELEAALNDLDEKYRLVFILRDVEGLSVKDTARILELTESNVKVRLLRARLALRERLTRKFGDHQQVFSPIHIHS